MRLANLLSPDAREIDATTFPRTNVERHQAESSSQPRSPSGQEGGSKSYSINAESVREFQPRVCFETLRKKADICSVPTLKELRLFCHSSDGDATPSELRLEKWGTTFSHGLELANAFSVNACRSFAHSIGKFHSCPSLRPIILRI